MASRLAGAPRLAGCLTFTAAAAAAVAMVIVAAGTVVGVSGAIEDRIVANASIYKSGVGYHSKLNPPPPGCPPSFSIAGPISPTGASLFLKASRLAVGGVPCSGRCRNAGMFIIFGETLTAATMGLAVFGPVAELQGYDPMAAVGRVVGGPLTCGSTTLVLKRRVFLFTLAGSRDGSHTLEMDVGAPNLGIVCELAAGTLIVDPVPVAVAAPAH